MRGGRELKLSHPGRRPARYTMMVQSVRQKHLITKKCVSSRKRLREAKADALRGEGLVAKRLLCRPFSNS